MDVPVRSLDPAKSWWWMLGAILLLALGLRLVGLHDPIMDHPQWRQGDTAAIARNFAQLKFNIFYPQTDYDGPPPNYVELELQIVPYLAAIGYKIFGVHEVFGRLISICFSLGTIVALAYFGCWLFESALVGLLAALLFAIFPGSIYYGRTFMPDTAMTFFFTLALYASARTLLAPQVKPIPWKDIGCAALLALAFLAKPVSALAVIPLACIGRLRSLILIVPAAISLWLYLDEVNSHAEWHWASGITREHVIPSLLHALVSPHAFVAKCIVLLTTIPSMLSTTMLGPAGFALALLGFLMPLRSRSNVLLYSWLLAAVLYAFVVVTVERVDYYLYPVLPLAALVGAAFIRTFAELWSKAVPRLQNAALAGAIVALIVIIGDNAAQIEPYYYYKRTVYLEARRLHAVLAPNTLVVMAHYDPSILYYMQHKGWEEDPLLWTPFDEQSAIRKGARYFIAVEQNRFEKNAELYAWMQRFPLLANSGIWPVYETDYAKMVPGAEARWRAFRRKEKAGSR
ncbi:MAG TPA: glycosyltransferase family 39 protein [Candidatus Acidoferrales bacterium]|nr:glycosyltransferase family 39 protein [Candidatus Acidoferrales bacterium]